LIFCLIYIKKSSRLFYHELIRLVKKHRKLSENYIAVIKTCTRHDNTKYYLHLPLTADDNEFTRLHSRTESRIFVNVSSSFVRFLVQLVSTIATKSLDAVNDALHHAISNNSIDRNAERYLCLVLTYRRLPGCQCDSNCAHFSRNKVPAKRKFRLRVAVWNLRRYAQKNHYSMHSLLSFKNEAKMDLVGASPCLYAHIRVCMHGRVRMHSSTCT